MNEICPVYPVNTTYNIKFFHWELLESKYQPAKNKVSLIHTESRHRHAQGPAHVSQNSD